MAYNIEMPFCVYSNPDGKKLVKKIIEKKTNIDIL